MTANECRSLWRALKRRPTIAIKEAEGPGGVRRGRPHSDAGVSRDNLEGERITDNIWAWGTFWRPVNQELGVVHSTMEHKVISVDVEAQTALLELTNWGLRLEPYPEESEPDLAWFLRGTGTVYFSDGTRREANFNEPNGSRFIAQGEWRFDGGDPMDPEAVVGFSWNNNQGGWYLPLDGDKAGPLQRLDPVS